MSVSRRDGDGLPKYDKRNLTYANSFASGFQASFIRAVEWLTGKVSIIRMVREFERRGGAEGLAFWGKVLDVMGIEITTPEAQFANIPKQGPVVVVANHPHGLVDGMVMAELIARVRPDFQILTREVLTGLDQGASSYLIPVPFPHDKDAQRKGKEMRARAMARLTAGGLICIFPSGVVATSQTAFGPVVEAEWNVFTAQMIRRSGAAVVPIHFRGQNSRAYHVANRLSPTLRQAMLLHEVVHVCNRPHGPVIGAPLTAGQMALLASDPRRFIAWLREHTLAL
ncbi:MAG: acyltransferase [Rhodobacterales bacterium CG2_30_65_12]|nr:MAG: acyltransferase [Rhodobacterales bacterium CG2_30_65_12]